MKTLTVIAALAVAAPAFAAPATTGKEAPSAKDAFELRLSEADGVRTIGVSRGDGRIAVARGGEVLDILPATDAQAAWAAFPTPQAPDEILWTEDKDGGAEDILIRRKVRKPEDGAEPQKSEKRVIIRKGEDADGEPVARIETDEALEIDDEGMIFLEGPGDGKTVRKIVRIEKNDADSGADTRRRLIRIDGAKAKDAARFIDDAKGLDASERAAMKKAVGL